MHQEARMPGSEVGRTAQNELLTLAEMMYYLSDPVARRKLEEFRIEYEKMNGPTDLTKRYTCTWPTAHQEWLINNETKQYYEGLPPFVQAWIKNKVLGAARAGRLDDVPDTYLRLYLKNEMTVSKDSNRSI
jgi:hypothetical protein